MLNSFYNAIFRPSQIRFPRQAAIAISLLTIFILASNAAARTNSGIAGAAGFALLFLFGGTLGWYWLSASINLIAQLLGGRADARTTITETAWGLWPLLFTGVAITAANWSALLGQLLSWMIVIGVFVTLTIAIRQVYQFGWLKASLCLNITLILSLLALSGLFLWPLMIFLGI